MRWPVGMDEVASAVALAAIGTFGADAARLHWDFTPPWDGQRGAGE